MTDISGTWATVGPKPRYEVNKDRSNGVKIRSKKQQRGTRMGIQSRGHTGGRLLVVTVDGWVTFKSSQYAHQERYKADDVYDNVFHGKPLPTPAERKAKRLDDARVAREEKEAIMRAVQ